MTKQASPLTLERREDGVGVVTFDVVGESVNTLRDDFADAFGALLDELESRTDLRAVVLRSGKPDSFVAGADIRMLKRVHTADEAADLSRAAQAAFARLEGLPIPVVAAIHGACLGGGLELALACTARVVSDDRRTELGLPECQLGLLPGGGGTQRLPRLIGIAAALDLLLTGKKLRGSRAKRAGLADEVVPKEVLLEAAAKRALSLAEHRGGKRQSPAARLAPEALQRVVLEENPLGRRVVFQQARKTVQKTTRGNYPAQELIVDVVETGYERGLYAGYAAEAEAFGRLVVSDTAEALIGVFQGMTQTKSAGSRAPLPNQVIVLGAGLMGAGVAYVSVARADVDVRLKDADEAGIGRGLKALAQQWDRGVARGSLSQQEADRQRMRVTTTTRYDGMAQADIVIEAVPEILELKRRVLRDVEAVTGPNTVFASNTSSIPITTIAAGASRPENVLGMHYFSPVEKMPLLEIITTEKTSDRALGAAVALGQAQGKTVIVVGDGPGFYTSRILAPYMNEAAHLLSEGVPIDRIDSALLEWGFPIGPMALLDEVGIDVAAKVGPILVDAFGVRMEAPGATDQLIRDGRLGKKAGRGLYRYGGGASKKERQVDTEVYALLGIDPTNQADPEVIAERCALLMVNEAALCLQEGILRSPADGDLGAIFGLGFPPFRGGPFRFVDQVSAHRVVERLREYEQSLGVRFAPAPALIELAESGQTYHTA
ncbi:MAG: fatty acid oxidation complex subunit alpha FadJ [Myxococcales bacterium]|nr:fatty acid oxidation complex subunit alpha FadJ [Myxococcales bacterium]MCB9521373.1 fatty acid oxidation complex subunit alpha FadJ [Myxococcales bacterium]MCB9532546.1 fatty acid oxidation complex subunit alpha FadJ [Myxococcales bacterium]MCB9533784.1 fatty acid oxidation complex subunit alpha FadJ [Myxococcales bacterium]